MQTFKGYLTVRDFADKVGMTDQAIRKALTAKRKRIKKFVKVGSMYLIHESELRNFKRLRESTR